MANISAPASTDSHSKHSISFNLSMIALAAALVGLGFAYLLDMAREAPQSGPRLNTQDQLIEKTVAGQHLVIPRQWFRFTDQLIPGFADQIDLTFALELRAGAQPQMVNVALMPRSRARASDRLLDSVYLHLFELKQLDGPVGLIGKPLKPVDGFQNETVWYDPISANPFVAKCTPILDDPAKSTCMRTILINDQVSATYVFDAEALKQWKQFDVQANRWLSRIGGI